MNLALATSKGGRFRANIFRQRGATGMVVRLVRTQIKTLDELHHPAILAELMKSKRGLILVVGGTGSGKSTTLAAMIDHRNRTETGHIITIEDPVEFIHPHQKCVVTQREVGIDTRSYHDALKNALRQAPDMILIGEIRDAETMEAAITFAETGHLCLATLHANNANQTIERVLNFFPPERAHEIRLQLSLNLRAIISQRLVPAQDGGRAAALEILLDTPRIRDLIKRGEIEAIKDAMEQGTGEGCKTFDAALYDLVVEGRDRRRRGARGGGQPEQPAHPPRPVSQHRPRRGVAEPAAREDPRNLGPLTGRRIAAIKPSLHALHAVGAAIRAVAKLLGMIAKEGWQKARLGEYLTQRQALDRFSGRDDVVLRVYGRLE